MDRNRRSWYRRRGPIGSCKDLPAARSDNRGNLPASAGRKDAGKGNQRAVRKSSPDSFSTLPNLPRQIQYPIRAEGKHGTGLQQIRVQLDVYLRRERFRVDPQIAQRSRMREMNQLLDLLRKP